MHMPSSGQLTLSSTCVPSLGAMASFCCFSAKGGHGPLGELPVAPLTYTPWTVQPSVPWDAA